MQSNVVRITPITPKPALAPAGDRERYKLHPTIAEAALLWSGLSFAALAECEYAEPGIPQIPGRPEVAARASALFEATEHGDLACTRHFKPGVVAGEPPEFPEEILENRTVARKDLVAWVEAAFPGEWPGSKAPSAQAQAEDELLKEPAVLAMLGGISHSTLYRDMNSRLLPRPRFSDPNRWSKLEVVAAMNSPAYLAARSSQRGKKGTTEDI